MPSRIKELWLKTFNLCRKLRTITLIITVVCFILSCVSSVSLFQVRNIAEELVEDKESRQYSSKVFNR
jgi:hypothetical protein